MICYHGSINTRGRLEDDLYRHRHAIISFAYPDSLDAIKQLSASYVLDNGAFTIWKQGKGAVDMRAYAEWVELTASSNFDWAIIPDVIDGTDAENDALVEEWPLDPTVSAPVFHLHEHLARLHRLLSKFRVVCIGSSEQYAMPGTDLWFTRMREVFEVCGKFKYAKIHGLRMMNPAIWTRLPFASVDSSNIARNQHSTPGGVYKMLRILESSLPMRQNISSEQGLFDAI